MKITKAQIKDVVVRMLKTLLVVALVAFITALKSSGMTDIEAALISAGSAAGTFVLNILIKLIKNFIDDWRITAEEIGNIFGEEDEEL